MHADSHRLLLTHQQVTRAIQGSGCSVASGPVQKRTLRIVVMILEEVSGIRCIVPPKGLPCVSLGCVGLGWTSEFFESEDDVLKDFDVRDLVQRRDLDAWPLRGHIFLGAVMFNPLFRRLLKSGALRRQHPWDGVVPKRTVSDTICWRNLSEPLTHLGVNETKDACLGAGQWPLNPTAGPGAQIPAGIL